MSPSSVLVQVAQIVLSVLEFLASPTGGREIGRDILIRSGLRGSRKSR